jgi:hypothetical protein
MEGASSKTLLKQTQALYPDAKAFHCFLEIAPFVYPEVIEMAHSNVKGEGNFGFFENY